ncbi:50S ribosomal protein L11 methyltransferase [Fangia hongkongensis]|uniref:50S ribosomal protein L11 methyltransferase n=1 Tax=Fangia hongkongensis TaxID=270495 RepID=UPI000379967C|nr:50S ribosomal protein L11 methyltransferase [Fangia hongkongensis]MBK2124150.1 50S ribosomal protein L11 methyltransferase [Fangia hongkongensis]
MLWKEISLSCSQHNLEIIENFLLELGACSISYQDAKDQPILEPKVGENPLWDEVTLVALFTEEYDVDTISTSLNNTHSNIISALTIRSFEDQDWTRTWMEDFKAMSFGSRLMIYPSWESPNDDTKVNLLLDPGLAFGTGTHPTTALCLKWLDENITIERAQKVVDFGCGSGILAIAAKKLGAQEVIAIDNDPQAILATKENALKNHISSGVIASLPSETPQNIQADVVIANILVGILIELKDDILSKLRSAGTVIFSGVLDSQVNNLICAYEDEVTFLKPTYKDEWALISGIKK